MLPTVCVVTLGISPVEGKSVHDIILFLFV